MGIVYNEEKRIFRLDTPGSSYMIKIADEENFVLHMYYGRRLRNFMTGDLCRLGENPYVPSKNNRDRCSFYDCAPFEYPAHGIGDYRTDAFSVSNENGHTATTLSYVSHRIYPGKTPLKGLPATFGGQEECTTLELMCRDGYNGLDVILSYTVFEDTDAIARSVRVKYTGDGDSKCTGPIYIRKLMSLCVDFDAGEYDTVFLHGSWARERITDRERLGYGKHGVSSVRGESSHQEHPFLGLLSPSATEDSGDVYGFNFVYSGNFTAIAEKSQFDSVRVLMGINPEDFSWKLEQGEEFQAPEAIMVYSADGIGGMSRTFHDLYRRHLIRSPYRDTERPVLINNWEATYFDFDCEKLISIAREAKKLGIEMLVMDDGWFGHRNDDNSSLGDWYVNEDKLKGGLKRLSDELEALGMKFGIWMEPEMISPDSELYREHPDWAIALPGKTGTLARNQYVLDLSRREVVDYTYLQIKKILESAKPDYLKWDMNRQLTDLGSCGLPADRQGELCHRYCLGVYEMLGRLVEDFPDLLLENCSGGGARFDPGMLYYGPQIWCSDNTDAVARLGIQQGTAMIYPLSAMGAHVSDCPNHTVGRVTPFETRGYVALAGTFGYELDVTRISEDDRRLIPMQVEMYHRFGKLVRTGDYYRLESLLQGSPYDAWAVVAKDRSEAVVTAVAGLNTANHKSYSLKLKGLDPDADYAVKYFDIRTGTDENTEREIIGGDVLMYAGLRLTLPGCDFGSRLVHIEKIQ